MNIDIEFLKYPIGKFQKPATITYDLIQEAIAVIKSFPAHIFTAVSPLSIEQLDTPYRPGGWTVRQLVHHCADSHMNAFTRFKLALTEENPAAAIAALDVLGSVGTRHLGLVWTWGALALIVTYVFVLQWREWWHFSLVFVALAGACLFLSVALRKDAESGTDDDTMLKLARIWLRVHFGAAIITVIGLIIDGKMVRFLVPRHQDWAAQNVFFFGAIALGAISLHTLRAMKVAQPAKS